MNQPLLQRKRVLDAAELQAYDWVRRIESGRMTHAEGAQLRRWCQADPAHAEMLSAARRKWTTLGAAAALAATRNPAVVVSVPAGFNLSNGRRRAFLGAAAGFTTAAVAAAVVYPPFDLWPSAGELRADYRTAVGEQRQLALAENVAVVLNTRTSVAVMTARDGTPGIDLIAGETAIDMLDAHRPFAVAAGAAHMLATEARFEVRRVEGSGGSVCVTCLQGQVRIAHAAGTATLNARQQMHYDDRTLHPVAGIDPAQESAWREGFLRFRDTPLEKVIDEINRYRPGRVVLLNRKMASEAVTARFRIDALDKAIAQMQRSLALEVRSLPGGVVLLS